MIRPVTRSPRVVAVLLVTTLVFVSLACDDREGPEQPPISRRPNVLLVSIDALRADHLGCYGYERETSPFIDGLSRKGIRFGNVSVNTHGTTPSHTTMLSGLYQETHRVALDDDDVAQSAISPKTVLLPEILKKAGYATIGITDGGNVGRRFGFAKGFDVFSDEGGGVEAVSDRLRAEIRQRVESRVPIFAFLHTYEVHSPYEPPHEYEEMFGPYESRFVPTSDHLLEHVHTANGTLRPEDLERIRSLYDAEIRYTDDVLRALFADLEESGFLANALVIVTGDHGEEFGEHGGLLHRDLLYEDLVHVPLIVSGPRLEPRLEASPVSLVDLAPSILAFVGEPIPAPLEGRPIVGNSPVVSQPVFAQYGRRRYSIRTERWKLIWNRSPESFELYDLLADPGEANNLAETEKDVVEDLSKQIRVWIAQRRPIIDRAPSAGELSDEEIENLKALGYLGGH